MEWLPGSPGDSSVAPAGCSQRFVLAVGAVGIRRLPSFREESWRQGSARLDCGGDMSKLIALIHRRFGPYHHARLRAAGRLGCLLGIEVVARDTTYQWDRVSGADGFERVTLFEMTDGRVPAPARVGRRLRVCLRNSNPAAVLIPGWSSPEALAAIHWCLRAGAGAVLMSDSQALDRPRTAWREAAKAHVARLFSAALVGGKPHADYAARLGVPSDRIFQGCDVVDNDHFASGSDAARREADAVRKRLDLPERYFLASGRFVEKKNVPRLLEAYAEYRKRVEGCAWKLVLLGDGPLRDAVRVTVRRLDLSGSVVLVGFRQYPELPTYYGLAGTFVHASTTEQWGLVVNEAMAAGLPVIVSNRCGCAPDLVVQGRNGFTFNPYDVGELANLMLKVSSTSDEERQAMGRASQEIISWWTPETFAEHLWKAARMAIEAPRPKITWFDKALLWALMHRLG